MAGGMNVRKSRFAPALASAGIRARLEVVPSRRAPTAGFSRWPFVGDSRQSPCFQAEQAPKKPLYFRHVTARLGRPPNLSTNCVSRSALKNRSNKQIPDRQDHAQEGEKKSI